MPIPVMAGVVALALMPVEGTADADLPMTAMRIIERVKARSAANHVAREGLRWKKTEWVYDLKDPDAQRLKQHMVWDVWFSHGLFWQQKVSHNGRIIPDPKKEQPPPDITMTLATLFQYSLAAPPIQPDPVSGRPCWVVKFAPSPDAQPNGTNEEVIGLLSGVIYVDEHGFWIRSASGKLQREYEKKYIISFGKASELNFTVEQVEELGAIMTHRVTLRYRYRKLFRNTNERREIVSSDFQFLDMPVITTTPSP